MSRTKLFVILGVCVASLLIGFTAEPHITKFISSALLDSGFANSESVVAYANWADAAFTVAEQATRADLIVRVRVSKVNEPRKLKQSAPIYEDDKLVGEGTDIMPFTDSDLQVLETYKGPSYESITVMQTGGSLPATDGDPSINLVMAGDPMFVEGSEHVLFLVDITNDGVHSTGRRLYRIVNPAGRYEIKNGALINFTAYAEAGEVRATELPQTLDDLLNQIKQAVSEQK